ncbi:MAG: sialate O-acetylesterase [Chthoniobacteraceae bacterium]
MKLSPPGILAAAFVVAGSPFALADVSLPAIFGDHMVLQRDGAVPVWGHADPGEKVTVSAAGASASATAGPDGKWSVRLKNLPPSATPVEVTVQGKNKLTFSDVLVGDVWVCSGQSNMAFGIREDASSKAEIAQANFPQIRFFYVPRAVAPQPAADIKAAPAGSTQGSWQVCTPESLSKLGFSAVGYYFGKDIHQATKQPVGLIESAWGGTVAQAWTSLETLKKTPGLENLATAAQKFSENFQTNLEAYGPALEKYKVDLAQWKEANKEALEAYKTALAQWQTDAKQAVAEGKPAAPKPTPVSEPKAPVSPDQSPNNPTGLYNGMIAPIVPYGIKGAIWYQGESNASQAVVYRTLFPAMIADWRGHWAQGDFPFLFVQLANYMARKPEPGDSSWALLREAQLKTLSVPNTGMAVIIDLGEGSDIHPKDKWDVGARLALAGRHVAYGEKLAYSGPIYKALKVEGNQARLTFDHTDGGLTIGVPPEHFHPGEPRTAAPELQGFAIAGADNKFVWAKAKIDGDTVVVSAEGVTAPVAVRYAWADNPEANLYNKAGLPASPFRTDTDEKK